MSKNNDLDISEILEKLYGLKGIKPLHGTPTSPKSVHQNGKMASDSEQANESVFHGPPKKVARIDDKRKDNFENGNSVGPNRREQNDKKLDSLTHQAESMLPVGLTLKESEVTTKIPELLRGKLRDYQHIGLDWLVGLFEQNLNGILADEMGLGKTIQTISVLAHLACDKQNWGPHLIIVPTSVLLNWDLEFKKWLPGFKVITYFGSQKERKEKRRGWSAPNAFHVCVTSYNLAINDQRIFKRVKWKYIILDEAHNIKNWMSQRWQTLLQFKSDNRLLLTGTPLQNNLLELWALLHFLMPDLFDSRKGKLNN